MKKTYYILALVIICFLGSCRTVKTKVTETKTKTDIRKKREVFSRLLDTTIYRPKEVSTLSISKDQLIITDDRPKTFEKRIGRSTAKITVDKDGVSIECKCDSIKERLKVLEIREKETEETQIDQEVETKEKVKRGFSFFDLLFYLIIAFSVGFAAGYLT